MSLLNAIKVRLGISPTQSNNFELDASAANGTMKLARANGQDVLTVDAAGVLNAISGLQKGGSVVQALSDFTGTNVSLTPNGYQKLPSGLIIQWMNIAAGGSSFTFPIAFPNACQTVVWMHTSGTGSNILGIASKSTTGFTTGTALGFTHYAMAIGY